MNSKAIADEIPEVGCGRGWLGICAYRTPKPSNGRSRLATDDRSNDGIVRPPNWQAARHLNLARSRSGDSAISLAGLPEDPRSIQPQAIDKD